MCTEDSDSICSLWIKLSLATGLYEQFENRNEKITIDNIDKIIEIISLELLNAYRNSNSNQ